MIWKVAACVIWAEWFVRLSWTENAHKVTNASVNLFDYNLKEGDYVSNTKYESEVFLQT